MLIQLLARHQQCLCQVLDSLIHLANSATADSCLPNGTQGICWLEQEL